MCLNIFEPSFFCEHCYCSLFIFAGTVISGAKLTTHVMKLTSVKEEKIKKANLYKCPNTLIFHPSQFPGTIPEQPWEESCWQSQGRKPLRYESGWWKYLELTPCLNLRKYLHCQMLHFQSVILTLKNDLFCHISIYLI